MTVAGWNFAGLFVQQFVSSATGQPLVATNFTVYESDAVTPATLYTDHTKATPSTNPAVTDANGNGSFYAVPGKYVISCNGGLVTVTVEPWFDEMTVIALDDNPLWDDMRVPLLSSTLGASAPGLDVFTGSGGVRAYAFDASTMEQVFLEIQMPHDWASDLGHGVSDVKPHLHWSPKTTNTGVVRWGLEYTWQNVNGTYAVPSTIYAEQAGAGTAYGHQIAVWSAIAASGMKRSSVLVARLFRDATHGNDTFTGDAYGLSFDLHYQRVGMGSQAEYPST